MRVDPLRTLEVYSHSTTHSRTTVCSVSQGFSPGPAIQLIQDFTCIASPVFLNSNVIKQKEGTKQRRERTLIPSPDSELSACGLSPKCSSFLLGKKKVVWVELNLMLWISKEWCICLGDRKVKNSKYQCHGSKPWVHSMASDVGNIIV